MRHLQNSIFATVLRHISQLTERGRHAGRDPASEIPCRARDDGGNTNGTGTIVYVLKYGHICEYETFV